MITPIASARQYSSVPVRVETDKLLVTDLQIQHQHDGDDTTQNQSFYLMIKSSGFQHILVLCVLNVVLEGSDSTSDLLPSGYCVI